MDLVTRNERAPRTRIFVRDPGQWARGDLLYMVHTGELAQVVHTAPKSMTVTRGVATHPQPAMVGDLVALAARGKS